MIKTIRTIYPKILVSILVPIFLSLSLAAMPPLNATAQIDRNINVVFQTKEGLDNSKIFERYNLVPKSLDIIKAFRAVTKFTVLEQMKRDSEIMYAEEDLTMVALTVVASDPFFTLDSTLEDKQWYLAKTKVPEAWDYSKGSLSVIVAIIDTGIHAEHLELNDGRVGEGYNVLTSQVIPANTNSDDNGHGTAVAGVIGAIPNNQMGIAGVNWQVKLMPIKALLGDGTGNTSDVAIGIIWAADHGANIINLSLGGPGFATDITLSNAITYAYNKGALIVSAAGNDLADQGLNLDANPVYPVCSDNGKNMVLGVAATDANDQKTSFSNFGASCVDISAPGKRILTTAFLPSDPSNNVLIYGSGTSMSTPLVAGIAALIKSTNFNLTNVQIQDIIMKTADNIDFVNQMSCLGGSCNGFLGKGRINALAAVAPKPISNGSLVREMSTGRVYIILNNTKRFVSDFVFFQRGFSTSTIVNEFNNQLASFSTSSALPPLEGTLIMEASSPQVYVIDQELKRPLTYLVFISRGYNFANINILSPSELELYQIGDWYWPPDGTMVLVKDDPTVYVMYQQVRRPVTFFVFTQRKLSFTKVIKVTMDEFGHVPKPTDFYWLGPVDGTLVKSQVDPGIYVIENGTKKLLSFNAFMSRSYNFSSVKVLPQAEIDVIEPGTAIL